MLLDEVGDTLAEQGGYVHGCDMNTTVDDMAYLAERSPCARGIGNSACCPNTATAYGVPGGVEATLGGDEGSRCSCTAAATSAPPSRGSSSSGAASVHTIDMAPSRAEIAGCVNVSESHKESWWAGNYDAIVPCSSSGLFTAQIAAELRCGAIVGATNLPFATRADQEVAEIERGVKFVPEGVSSAGAVIVDSIEHFRPQAFAAAEPEAMYEFTREVVREKVAALVLLAERLNVPPSLATPLITADRSETPIGMRSAPTATAPPRPPPRRRRRRRSPGGASRGCHPRGGAARRRVPLRPDPRPRQLAATLAAGKSGSVDSRRAARALDDVAALRRQQAQLLDRRRAAGACDAVGARARGRRRHRRRRHHGLNIAYQLRRRDASLSITVLERAPAATAPPA